MAEARGAADALALRLRHHDPKLHARAGAGGQRGARRCSMRWKRRGSRRWAREAMDGVRANLDDLAEARVRIDAITRARTAEEVPLATAVGLLARQRLTGEAPPQGRARGARRWSLRGSRRRPAPSSTRWR